MSRKILLVDDNIFNRKFTRDLLTMTNLEVIEAKNCQQGVEMAISQHPALILLDAAMATISDSKAFTVLRQFPSTRRIPILPITSQLLEGEPVPRTSTTANTSLGKPISIQALIAKIQPYVSIAKSMMANNSCDCGA